MQNLVAHVFQRSSPSKIDCFVVVDVSIQMPALHSNLRHSVEQSANNAMDVLALHCFPVNSEIYGSVAHPALRANQWDFLAPAKVGYFTVTRKFVVWKCFVWLPLFHFSLSKWKVEERHSKGDPGRINGCMCAAAIEPIDSDEIL